MCPAVAKTSEAEIISAAREIIERDGAELLSMQAVGKAVGVQAPSLYKRFPHREALLNAVVDEALVDLRAALESVTRGKSASLDLVAMVRAYRAFGKANPGVYAMLFSGSSDKSEATTRTRAVAAEGLLARTTALVGATHSLAAARTITAFIHGFVSMELAGAFRLGGNVDQAYSFGIDTIIKGLERNSSETPRTSGKKTKRAARRA